MKRFSLCLAALLLLTACAGQQLAADTSPDGIATDTGRWESEQSRETLIRLKGPVTKWTQTRR